MSVLRLATNIIMSCIFKTDGSMPGVCVVRYPRIIAVWAIKARKLEFESGLCNQDP